MAIEADDLRKRLQIPTAQWDSDDGDFADAAIASATRVVRAMVGATRFDDATDAQQDAIDEATLEYAAIMFANPERVLQRRAGTDTSVSFADASEAADARGRIRSILAGAFGSRAVTVTL